MRFEEKEHFYQKADLTKSVVLWYLRHLLPLITGVMQQFTWWLRRTG